MTNNPKLNDLQLILLSTASQRDGGSVLPPAESIAIVELLRRPAGATLTELIDATGWLPHTTRAALTGLRKKGHVIDKTKRDDATCYRIPEVA